MRASGPRLRCSGGRNAARGSTLARCHVSAVNSWRSHCHTGDIPARRASGFASLGKRRGSHGAGARWPEAAPRETGISGMWDSRDSGNRQQHPQRQTKAAGSQCTNFSLLRPPSDQYQTTDHFPPFQVRRSWLSDFATGSAVGARIAATIPKHACKKINGYLYAIGKCT